VIILSKYNRRAAKTAKLCRTASENIRYPTILEQGALAITVGAGKTVNFYFASGNLYEAQFSIDSDNNISWTRNGQKPKELQEVIDRFFFLVLNLRGKYRSCSFHHWCSISCNREHGA
jgi:hypothetical protein